MLISIRWLDLRKLGPSPGKAPFEPSTFHKESKKRRSDSAIGEPKPSKILRTTTAVLPAVPRRKTRLQVGRNFEGQLSAESGSNSIRFG